MHKMLEGPRETQILGATHPSAAVQAPLEKTLVFQLLATCG